MLYYSPAVLLLVAIALAKAPHRVLKGHQDTLLTLLHRAGVSVYYWTPQTA